MTEEQIIEIKQRELDEKLYLFKTEAFGGCYIDDITRLKQEIKQLKEEK